MNRLNEERTLSQHACSIIYALSQVSEFVPDRQSFATVPTLKENEQP